MRWPRVRFTVRRLMVGVAIVASVLAYFHHKKSAAFRVIAEANAQIADEYAGRARKAETVWKTTDDSLGSGADYLAKRQRTTEHIAEARERMIDGFRQDLDKWQGLFSHYKGLEQKYRRAAANPWLPIAPDLPPPLPAATTVIAEQELVSPSPVTIVPSLPKIVFEFGEHPIFGRSVPLVIEFRNHSDRPVTICPISVVAVTDETGKEPELTGQGGRYQEAFRYYLHSSGGTRRKHASIVLQPGGFYRDEGLDLTGLYRFRPGRYAVRVIWNDPPLWDVSAPISLEIRRAKSGH